MREMVAAGRYYERDATLLREEIDAHYNGTRGPGAPPLSTLQHKTKAILVPNSPYKNCGDCMAWAYKELAESPLPSVYVIIATNQGSQESGLSITTFETPLGLVRVDQELAKLIASKGTIDFNEEIHARDFPIEVQIPWIQHAKEKDIERIKILPILVSRGLDVQKLALDIKEALMELERTAVFIVSSDLTHQGPLFHYVPFSMDVEKQVYELDKGAIDTIIRQDANAFVAYARERRLNYHGTTAIELLLRLLKRCHVRLEQYYTSGDIYADYKNSVSYATIVFEELPEKEEQAKPVYI